jgi:hypothetical protein
MRRTWIGAAATAAITFGAAGYAVAENAPPSSPHHWIQKGSDPPPGDAFTNDRRGERAQTAAPQKSTGEMGPSMGENQKPHGMVGP